MASPEASAVKVTLLKTILAKMVQITFYERTEEVIPEELRVLMPPKDIIHFEY